MAEPLRVLVNDHSGHPFQIQLSRALAARRHAVLHTFSASFQSPKGPLERREEDPEHFQIEGIRLRKPFQKYSLLQRRSQEREYGHRLVKLIRGFEPDVVISSNTPLDAQAVIQREAHRSGRKFVFWAQDLYSVAMRKILARKLSWIGHVVGSFYEGLERAQLRRSDAVVLVTDDFEPIMRDWGIADAKCWVIPNWAPLDDLREHPKDNSWSRHYGLSDKLCVMYSGTLGMKHDPAILVEIAQGLHRRKDVRVVVLSEGLGVDWLKARKAELGLENLILLGFQPFEDLSMALSSADVFVAILEPDAGVFSVPSKVLTYMCFRRPLVLAVPEENLAARTVGGAGAGYVVDPLDRPGIIAAVDRLVEDGSLRDEFANNAVAYAHAHFAIDPIADRFEQILEQLS